MLARNIDWGLMPGAIALVGSGEYLSIMEPFEANLIQLGIAQGKFPKYVQLATAAGKENFASLQRWRELGEQQANRIGIEPIFIEAFNRDDAHNMKLVELVEDAALIYFSGGDPIYLTQSLIDSPLIERIRANWQAGSSVAGCSAGAMALAAEVANPFKLTAAATPGLRFVSNLKVLPHFDRYFGWIPTPMAKFLGKASDGVLSVGIDENTAMFATTDLNQWEVWGFGKVQPLNQNDKFFTAGKKLLLNQELNQH